MANILQPSLNIGNGNWAVKTNKLLGYRITDSDKYTPKEGDSERESIGSYIDRNGVLQTGIEKVYGNNIVSNPSFADPVIGSELVTNGGFDTATDWTLDAGITISGGALNIAVGTSSSATQTISVSEGKFYEVVFDISAHTSGGVRVTVGGTATNIQSAVGTFTQIVQAGVGTEVDINTLGGATLSVDNVSVREVNSAWNLDTDVLIQNNELVFDGALTGVAASQPLTAEVGLSYRITYTINSYTAGSVYVRFGGATLNTRNTEGTFTEEILATVTPGVFEIAANEDGTELSINNIEIEEVNEIPANINESRVDFSEDANGVLLLEPQGTNLYLNSELLSTQNVNTIADTYTVSFYGTGTIDFTGSYVGQLVGVDDSTRVILTFTASAGVLTNTVTGEVKYAQCENNDIASSYIYTDGSTQVRLQDECGGFGSVNDFNSEEGVLYVDIAALSQNSSGNRILAISDGSTSNRVQIFYDNSNRISVSVIVGGSTKFSTSFMPLDSSVLHKVALKYKQDDFSLYVDGVKINEDFSGDIFTPNTLNTFDFKVSSSEFFGRTKSVKVYKQALTDTELQELTTTGQVTI